MKKETVFLVWTCWQYNHTITEFETVVSGFKNKKLACHREIWSCNPQVDVVIMPFSENSLNWQHLHRVARCVSWPIAGKVNKVIWLCCWLDPLVNSLIDSERSIQSMYFTTRSNSHAKPNKCEFFVLRFDYILTLCFPRKWCRSISNKFQRVKILLLTS